MKRTIVFTGLVRNEARFISFLEQYHAHPGHADIPLYYSTWFGELDRYPVLRQRLQELNAIVIEQKQPDLVLKGHALHQLTTLDLPFSLIPDDVFVFKSRPDFANYNAFLRYMQYTPVATAASEGFDCLPQYRFLIHGLFGAQPFYINDITFAGMAADLRRLTALSMMDMVRYFRIAPEQLIWAPQFIQRNSVLDIYFRGNIGLIFNNESQTQRNILALQECPAYLHALAFYFLVIQQAFDFFEDEPHITPTELACHTVEELLWQPLLRQPPLLPFITHNASCSTNHFNVMQYIDGIVNGACAPSSFGTNLHLAIETIRKQHNHFPATYFNSDMEKYARFCATELEVHGSKILHRQGDTYRIDGASADWQQANLGTPITEKLEAEVNYLRRTLNDMEHQLDLARLTPAAS
jgi:hypothetical protein